MKHSSHLHRACRNRQAGVGLIEVLVAVLVVSIGFLGVAALQVTSLSTNNSAMARSMATISSYSILDAMRLDRANALAGKYDGTVKANACASAGSPATGTGTGGTGGTGTGTGGTGTTSPTLAKAQLKRWCQQLGHNLGAAATTTGKVECTKTGTSAHRDTGYCTVTIQFDDSRSGIGGGVDANGITSIITKAEI